RLLRLLLDLLARAFDIAPHALEGIAGGKTRKECDQKQAVDDFSHDGDGLDGNQRMSTKCPAMPAAAAMAGLTRWVRPPAPCRPSKLRLDVEAQRSPGSSRSAFMARHIEQPGSRHSKPAARKTLSRPSASAWAFTRPEPGTTIASLTLSALRLPRTTAAAWRRSSMRELVHEPMKTLSIRISVTGVLGSSPM